MENIRPVVLIVMDGYGLNPSPRGNAIAAANRPVINQLWERNPHTELQASGKAVGLPEGQMGNSEVGHLNLGAGKIVYQDFTRISQAIEDQSFFRNPILCQAMDHVKQRGSALQIIGLIGPGGVHAHPSHLFALMEMARRERVEQLYIHAVTDGRDTPPTDAAAAAGQISRKIGKLDIGQIATVSGRYYAMDRDGRWQRTQKAYEVMVHGQGPTAPNAKQAIRGSYADGVTDEFIIPTVLTRRSGGPIATIQDHDAVVFFNFRTDRPRQLVQAFVQPDFHHFDRGPKLQDLFFVTMTEYEKDLPVHVAFETEDVPLPLAKVLADHELTQLHAAETEKYAHVTFFFNGGREEPFRGEDRILVPSPRDVGTYDKKPEMSAIEIAEKSSAAIRTGDHAFALINFANADMVGHTGVMEAAVKAVETVDRAVGMVVDATESRNGVTLITADHGNAEQMLDESGKPYTAHTIDFLVPFILVTSRHSALKEVQLRSGGELADVAPTVLQLLGVPKPVDMEGQSLIEGTA
ncbi:MAG: 2,3-bisphosphoglycerate-independent phosphoglycerate mutase [Chloroflexota bacterium]